MRNEIDRTTKGSLGNWRQFLNLMNETKPSKLMLFAALLMSVGGAAVSLVIPMFTKGMVDNFAMSQLDTMQIAALAIAFVVQTVAAGLSIYMLNLIGQRVVAGLRDRLWKKMLVLPVSYYDRNKTGETVSRITNDTGIVKGFITEHLSGFFTGIISVIGSLIVLLYLDWQMTVIMLLVIPLAALVLFPLGNQMFNISKGLQDETASFTAVLSQVLSEIRLVKASNAEAREYENGRKAIARLLRFGIKEGVVQALISPIMSFVLMVLLVVIIGYGGMRVSSGALTAGELVAFILYLIQIVMPMSQLSMFFTQLQKAIGATEHMIAILQAPEEDPMQGKEAGRANLPIHAEHVHFAYAEGEPILEDVSFTINPGKVTAIVGPSGSGKTTLFSLFERFYLPVSGVIKLGNEDINEFSLFSWRALIGYVSQESPLIDGTIRENICYGMNRAVTDEELKRAAAMAYADGFIEELADGYDTEVGERGMKLSGGQRQRIAIARALLRNPRILMLDEATSSLDSKSEIVVQKALNNLMKGRTTLVIAHRLSTVVDADQILFIDRGRLTGCGTHEQLLESHSMYREFAAQQLKIQEQHGS